MDRFIKKLSYYEAYKLIREPLPGSTCVRHGASSKSKPSKPSGTSQKIVRFPSALVGTLISTFRPFYLLWHKDR